MDKLYTAKNDVIFKSLFTRNKKALCAFIQDVLEIPVKSEDDIELLNVELTPEIVSGKFSRLDINVKLPEQSINIEMQVLAQEDYIKRILFYWAKLYTSYLEAGNPYKTLRQTISVNILNFDLFDCESYWSRFSLREDFRNELLTDLQQLYFFELGKLDKKLHTDDRKKLWMQLINAEDEEGLNMMKQANVGIISDCVDMIYSLNADTAVRELAREREKARLDEISALYNAKEEGRAEGEAIGMEKGRAKEREALIQKLRSKNMSKEEIKELLGTE